MAYCQIGNNWTVDGGGVKSKRMLPDGLTDEQRERRNFLIMMCKCMKNAIIKLGPVKTHKKLCQKFAEGSISRGEFNLLFVQSGLAEAVEDQINASIDGATTQIVSFIR